MKPRKDFFGWSSSERKGILVLLVILIVVIILPSFLPKHQFPPEDIEKLKADFRSFDSAKIAANRELNTNTQDVKLFTFDPNTADSSAFLLLGFSEKQINTIINYRKSGAVFNKKEDFKKCYAVSEEKYNDLKDFIRIKPFTVELNSADTSELKRLKGIGSYYAKRIIEYRERLGGFYDPKQLLEINGIDNDRFNLFAENIRINARLLRKMPVNTVDEKILRVHPYIGERYSMKINEYRTNAKILSIYDMIDNGLIGDSSDKIVHYFDF